MVTTCAVVGCQSTWNPFTGVSFHRITKNKKILPLWLRVVDIKIADYARICSVHFKPEDFVDCKDGKRLKRDAVPTANVSREADGTDEDSFEEDEDDNKNLSMLKKLLAADSNPRSTAAQNHDNDDSNEEQPEKFEVVISNITACKCISSANTTKSKQIKSMGMGTQVNKTTEGEIALRQRVKLLGLRLRRRDAKISYMKTVFNMIKKHVKGTDMEYKLSCELQNISEFSEPIRSNVKKNARNTRAKAESPVSDCNNDDEESSADENGMCMEVVLSPNLKPRNGLQL